MRRWEVEVSALIKLESGVRVGSGRGGASGDPAANQTRCGTRLSATWQKRVEAASIFGASVSGTTELTLAGGPQKGWVGGASLLEEGVRAAAMQSRDRPPDGAAGKTKAAASHAPAAWPCSSSPGCEMHFSEVLGLDPPGASRVPKPGTQSHIFCVLPTILFPVSQGSATKCHLLWGSS